MSGAGAAPPGRWAPTRALTRGIGIAVLAVLVAIALGRPELVLVALPFALGTALSLTSRPAALPRVSLELEQPTTVEGGPVSARVRVEHTGRRSLVCVVHAQVPPWVRLRHGFGYYAALARPDTVTRVRVEGTARRWGSYRLGPVRARVVAGDGLLVTDSQVMPAVPLIVYPISEPFSSGQGLPRAAGIVGIHRSRRPGDGLELADVRPFQAGDRLRRINWRVTRRTGAPHVNATVSERDAEVLLLLDTRRDSGESGGVDGPASVLDLTVRAAAAIAEHYVQQGDRVGLVEFGSGLGRLRSGTGRRHFLTVLEWLARLHPSTTGLAPTGRLLQQRLQPPSALLIVLTPLLDYDSVNLLAELARSGRALITVDTLPQPVRPVLTSPWSEPGSRLWLLERANTIGRLRAVGVPVEPWQGPGTLDLMLRHVSRLAAAGAVRR